MTIFAVSDIQDFMKIILVSIHIKKNAPEAIPLAAAMLKSACDDLADISLSEFALDDNENEIVSALKNKRPDGIGFCVYLWNREIICNIIKKLRNECPEMLLFAGGPDITANISHFIKNTPVDFAVSGEGENVLRSVLKKINENGSLENIHEIQGVATKNFPDAKIALSIEDLSSLPSPYLSGILDVKKYNGVLWELSRGCPFQCAFCYESKGNANVRQFCLERIEKELELFEKNGVEQVFVLDPTFNKNKQRAKQILRLIQSKAPDIHFTFEVRTEFLDEEMAELFASVSCGLQIGLQSTNITALAEINRRFDSNAYSKKIKLLNEYGVIFGLDLIFGLPKDSFSDFCKSLDYAINLQPNNLDIFQLAVLPGTVLYDYMEKENIRFMKEPPYLVQETHSFSEEDLLKANNLKKACDIFYNDGRAVGWLYIILETLKISPSDFFLNFYNWLNEKKKNQDIYDETEIFNLQIEYTKSLFEQKRKINLFLPVADIITLHNSLNKSLTAASLCSMEIKSTYNLPLSTRLVELHYDVDDLFQAAVMPLKYWIKEYKMQKTFAITWNKNGNSDVMMLDKKWFLLLKNLNGKKKFTSDEKEFLDYCVDENILI